MHILRCIGSKFCEKFQRAPLKFHTKLWTHTPPNMHFTVFYFCVWVTTSLNCDVISLSETGPWWIVVNKRECATWPPTACGLHKYCTHHRIFMTAIHFPYEIILTVGIPSPKIIWSNIDDAVKMWPIVLFITINGKDSSTYDVTNTTKTQHVFVIILMCTYVDQGVENGHVWTDQ